MAGKRPTRPQIRSRRRALNSYLLSTESSYSDLAKKFGVREDTLRNFLGKDTKTIRTQYNSSPGYRKLYNAAAKDHKSDLRKEAKSEGKHFYEIPATRRTFRAPQVVNLRRKAFNEPRVNKEARRELFQRASRMQEYTRNVERDYGALLTRKEKQALDFQQLSFEKRRPARLYEFLDTYPEEEDIEDYIDDVIEIYHLNETQAAAVNERIAGYLR